MSFGTTRNRDEASSNDGELGKKLPTHAQGGILQAFILQTVRSQLKTCMFRILVGTKEKCLAKQGKKLFFKDFRVIFVNQQRFCKFHPFRIKRNIK